MNIFNEIQNTINNNNNNNKIKNNENFNEKYIKILINLWNWYIEYLKNNLTQKDFILNIFILDFCIETENIEVIHIIINFIKNIDENLYKNHIKNCNNEIFISFILFISYININ